MIDKRAKNSNLRMKTKGNYENRELLLIYSKIKKPSKERFYILKNRELTVNPLSLFRSRPISINFHNNIGLTHLKRRKLDGI
jgi:hypothetical protein